VGKSSSGDSLNVYLPKDILAFLRAESARLERPMSWIVQRSIRLHMKESKALPSIPSVGP
jgi:uncharacterized small protein (TIGR04563 family)